MRRLLTCALLCLLLTPALAQTRQSWEERLLHDDRKVRAAAEAALAKAAPGSLAVLRKLLSQDDEDLQAATFEVIRRIGPPSIPMLVELLRDKAVFVRRNAIDTLIDFAPHTEAIQPALRRALSDEDEVVAGDAARECIG